jgi:hypothetical protein
VTRTPPRRSVLMYPRKLVRHFAAGNDVEANIRLPLGHRFDVALDFGFELLLVLGLAGCLGANGLKALGRLAAGCPHV